MRGEAVQLALGDIIGYSEIRFLSAQGYVIDIRARMPHTHAYRHTCQPSASSVSSSSCSRSRSDVNLFQSDLDRALSNLGLRSSSWADVCRSCGEVDRSDSSRSDVANPSISHLCGETERSDPDASRSTADVRRFDVDLSLSDVDLSRSRVDLSRSDVDLFRSDVDLSRSKVRLSRLDEDLSRCDVDLFRWYVTLSRSDVGLFRCDVAHQSGPPLYQNSLNSASLSTPIPDARALNAP